MLSGPSTFLLLLFGVNTAQATVKNYYGTASTDTSWFTPSNWKGGDVPDAGESVWMNTKDTLCVLTEADGWIAVNSQLVVGRKSDNTAMKVQGATLTVGIDHLRNDPILLPSPDGSFMLAQSKKAQDASLEMTHGKIIVVKEFTVGGSGGSAAYVQTGGTVYTYKYFRLGRKKSGRGNVMLNAGSINVGSLAMKGAGSVVTIVGGILGIRKNSLKKVTGLIAKEKIFGATTVKYDSDLEMTLLFNPQFDSSAFTNYVPSGASVDSWFNPNNWQTNNAARVPNIASEVWLNHASTSIRIDEGEIATVSRLSIGRHALDVFLHNDGGILLVGDETVSNSIVYIGQYDDSTGVYLQTKSTAVTKVYGELNVATLGSGELRLEGGSVIVKSTLVVGRYEEPAAVGRVYLDQGSLHAASVRFNSLGKIELRGGILSLDGDKQSMVDGFLSSNNIVSAGDITVTFDGTRTVVISSFGPPRPMPMPTTPPFLSPTPPPVIPDQPVPPPTLFPTLTPNASPTQTPYASTPTDEWDVAGMLEWTLDEVGPIMPRIVRDNMKIRTFTPVPETFVHPRVLLGPDEIDAVRTRLLSTTVGRDAIHRLTVYGTLLTKGRSEYNQLPAEVRNMLNGAPRLGNVGLHSLSNVYDDLIRGDSSSLASVTHSSVLLAFAGQFAMEAFYCSVFNSEVDAAQRATDLAAAMTTWANMALQDSDFDEKSREKFGSLHLALAYDLNYNAMTESQRSAVRKAIVRMMRKWYSGTDTAPYATTTNWVPLDSFTPIMAMSIEGETTTAEHGWSAEENANFLKDISRAWYKFLTYGWYSSGAPYEGTGKNYQFAAVMPAFAKRGYNFFTHPNVQAFAQKYAPAQLQPFGHYITKYDTLGGTGNDPTIGGAVFHDVDIIGLKFGFPDDPSIDFAWRQFAESPVGENDAVLALSDTKVDGRSIYKNAFLYLLLMASDYNSVGTFEEQNRAALGTLSFAALDRGLIISRSAYHPDALAMHHHVRQDLGGHTHGDRNTFTLSGLGRMWVYLPSGSSFHQTQWSSCMLVNGEGIVIAPREGKKSRQPGYVAYYEHNEDVTFTVGDATYAYNNEWDWRSRALDDPAVFRENEGFETVTDTWNDFRPPEAKIPYDYGDVPYYNRSHWNNPGQLEGIVKRRVLDLTNMYRMTGIVRGTYPYAMLIDDVHKATNDGGTLWSSLAQIPSDLTMLPVAQYSEDANLDASRDVVLQEPNGNRRLLIRIINSEGTKPSGSLAEMRDADGWRRLVIDRVSEYPRFRIMFYPYRQGEDPVPVHTLEATPGHISQVWPQQRDTHAFEPYTKTVGPHSVEITGFRIFRDGKTLIDTRNKVNPLTKL